ncbi:hypothetical protein HETIRDRAFT_119210 [Heterobasidion irregulare TC 32-1]|uniref:C2H2-type domain-containing protein n=1 Tax=Heterobasidion irregulare (strain TC 32-1) TaxID=747525 RepID=W4JQR4_HETIT|nr:uncharacterized protein HETIRDRAFT_119210 [Heterobasidion irregulare TC 32-1]ETW75902.1 hypothetical protein HETIRDRAFT_119210 [Heterobasidion irregulare TC 32-1]
MPAQYMPPLLAPTSSTPPRETTYGIDDMEWVESILAPTPPVTASQGISNDKKGNALSTNDDISWPLDIMRQLPTASPDPNIIPPLARGLFPSSASDTSTTTDSTMPLASNNHQPAFSNAMQAIHDDQQCFHGVKETTQAIAQMFGTGVFDVPTQAADTQATSVGQWTQQTFHDAYQRCYGAIEALYSIQQAFRNAQVMYGTQPQQIFRYILENLGTIFNTAMQTTGEAPQLEVDLPWSLQHAMQAIDNTSQSVTGALPTPILPPLRPRLNQTPYMSGEHNCHSCGLGFHSKNSLEKHNGNVRHHTRLQELNPDTELHPRQVLCNQCGHAFADAYSLSRHKKKHHAESA